MSKEDGRIIIPLEPVNITVKCPMDFRIAQGIQSGSLQPGMYSCPGKEGKPCKGNAEIARIHGKLEVINKHHDLCMPTITIDG